MGGNNTSFSKFLVLWGAQLIASIGSGLTAFALGVYVYGQTGTAVSVAMVTLCAFLPSVLLNPVGGVLADRYDRRLMMVLGDFGSAAALIFMLAAMGTGSIAVWQICIAVSVSSVFVALMQPAYKATVTDLLTEDQFSKAGGLVQLASSAQFLLSPFIAGFLLGFTDIRTILIIDIATLGITIFAALFVRRGIAASGSRDRNAGNSFAADLRDGWQAITSRKGVLLLIGIISAITFYMGLLQTLIGPMILSFKDAKALGITESLSAAGMLVTSIFIGIFSMKANLSRVLGISLAAGGIFFAAMGLRPELPLITGAGFLFFACLPFINTSAEVMIRKNIPNEKQGRAWGLIGVISQLGYLIAYAAAGFLADRIFNPLLVPGGLLAPTAGRIIGTGPGRGIGLIFIIAGLAVSAIGCTVSRLPSIKALGKGL
ncbi:MFS transporter [Breznakiella homolactica]|uniref:MFS transporter n=1 Tax=Breznakiella homolactica TaxID=2798577 RepID=A0A7T8B918_9SPIR|nr:MFS transporter [Breznakiella homolactica]QQO07982.1 MFS transporter [Breznakiella homolactica]